MPNNSVLLLSTACVLLLLISSAAAAPHESKRRSLSIQTNSTQTPASTTNSSSSPQKKKSLVDLAGRLYARLGNHKLNATAAALEFKDEYAALEATLVKQPLGESLIALLEMRLSELQASVQHARKMREAVGLLQGKP
jgi:hypothetical protein